MQYADFFWLYPFGHEFNADVAQVFSDSDRAGCRSSRKSTSGGVLVVDKSCLRGWSSTRSTVATSSGEAELFSLVEAAAEGLGFRFLAIDLGDRLESAVAGRLVGRQVNFVEERVSQDRARRCKVSLGRWVCKPAEILTKPHCANHMTEALRGNSGSLKSRRQETRAAVKPRWADVDE